jgi:hypothetical protein
MGSRSNYRPLLQKIKLLGLENNVGSFGEMNSTMVSLLAFVCTFGAALLAIFIRDRLPAHHVEGDSKDVVKLVLGLMATLTALVLGLLIS